MQSIVSYPDRGTYGNNRYRGNCSGRLIEDIIDQYHLDSLSDFMVGGGTTEDVVKAKNLKGTFADLNRGFDMLSMEIPERPKNIFWHPPYHDMVVYSDNMYKASEIKDRFGFDPKECDLSRCKNWDEFVKLLNHCMLKQYCALEKGGRIFTLMGDLKRNGRLYSMLCDIAKPGTLEQIVIKAQHNCWSDSVQYSNRNFVPIVHEYLLVLKKEQDLLVPVQYGTRTMLDVRKMNAASWRDAVHDVISDAGHALHLDELYEALKDSPKVKTNNFWREKIRQTVQNAKYFTRTAVGTYALAA